MNEISYSQITITMIKYVFFLTILIHIYQQANCYFHFSSI